MPRTPATPRKPRRPVRPKGTEAEALLRTMAALCREKRGEDIVALDVRGLADYMDFLLIVTGTSERQNRAIVDHVVRTLRPTARPLSVSGEEGGTWICADFVDVVLHVFDGPTRTHYDLELLWADAARVSLP